MYLILILPVLIAVIPWWRQRAACLHFQRNVTRLTRIRKDIRSVGAMTLSDTTRDSLGILIGASLSEGCRLADAVSQCVQWLRMDTAHGQKANRLRLLWTLRLLSVVLIAGAVRFVFANGTGAEDPGAGTADFLLTAAGGGALVSGSWLFYRMIPALELTPDGTAAGLVPWLLHRISADNGHCRATFPEILSIEDEEMRSGISLHADKVEALDALWRTRIAASEQRCEAALELMPVFEFVAFGVFLFSVLAGPLARDFF